MAGTLTIDTLKASSGVLATQNGMTGIAKAWVSFNGTVASPTIFGAFNVGSVTKNSTGNYTVNYTTALPSSNCAVQATSAQDYAVYSDVATVRIDSGVAPSTTSCRIVSMQSNTTSASDSAFVSATIFSA